MDQLQPIPLVTPGFRGLNTAQSSVPDLDPGWGVVCQNFVLDSTGRLASRAGWSPIISSSIAGVPAIKSLGEKYGFGAVTNVFGGANLNLYLFAAGAAPIQQSQLGFTATADNWQFLNFNNNFYAVQSGHPLIKQNGGSAFQTIAPSSGTVPSGGPCGLAAFGRLWIVNSDLQTISYCNLLDDTAWSGVGAGSINMATVWTKGMDQIVGLAAAGSKLVVFGTKHIIMYADSAGSVLGLNPQNLYVSDSIEGTGLLSRDTIQSTSSGDLMFLSPTGVQSLSRLVTSGKDNPIASLDPQVRDYVFGFISQEDTTAIKSAYSPYYRFYLILLPVSQRVFCYDTRQPLPDGTLRITEWTGVTWTSLVSKKDNTLWFGQLGTVGQYSGFTDGGLPFTAAYTSPPIALAPQFENKQKILKRMKAVLFSTGTVVVNFFWGVNFSPVTNTKQISLTNANFAEYGSAQYGLSEYGAGTGLTIQGFPLSASGRWMQFGFSAVCNGYGVALQQLDAFVKIGNTV